MDKMIEYIENITILVRSLCVGDVDNMNFDEILFNYNIICSSANENEQDAILLPLFSQDKGKLYILALENIDWITHERLYNYATKNKLYDSYFTLGMIENNLFKDNYLNSLIENQKYLLAISYIQNILESRIINYNIPFLSEDIYKLYKNGLVLNEVIRLMKRAEFEFDIYTVYFLQNILSKGFYEESKKLIKDFSYRRLIPIYRLAIGKNVKEYEQLIEMLVQEVSGNVIYGDCYETMTLLYEQFLDILSDKQKDKLIVSMFRYAKYSPVVNFFDKYGISADKYCEEMCKAENMTLVKILVDCDCFLNYNNVIIFTIKYLQYFEIYSILESIPTKYYEKINSDAKKQVRDYINKQKDFNLIMAYISLGIDNDIEYFENLVYEQDNIKDIYTFATKVSGANLNRAKKYIYDSKKAEVINEFYKFLPESNFDEYVNAIINSDDEYALFKLHEEYPDLREQLCDAIAGSKHITNFFLVPPKNLNKNLIIRLLITKKNFEGVLKLFCYGDRCDVNEVIVKELLESDDQEFILNVLSTLIMYNYSEILLRILENLKERCQLNQCDGNQCLFEKINGYKEICIKLRVKQDCKNLLKHFQAEFIGENSLDSMISGIEKCKIGEYISSNHDNYVRKLNE